MGALQNLISMCFNGKMKQTVITTMFTTWSFPTGGHFEGTTLVSFYIHHSRKRLVSLVVQQSENVTNRNSSCTPLSSGVLSWAGRCD